MGFAIYVTYARREDETRSGTLIVEINKSQL